MGRLPRQLRMWHLRCVVESTSNGRYSGCRSQGRRYEHDFLAGCELGMKYDISIHFSPKGVDDAMIEAEELSPRITRN
jgi:hypothetical protein